MDRKNVDLEYGKIAILANDGRIARLEHLEQSRFSFGGDTISFEYGGLMKFADGTVKNLEVYLREK